MITANVIYKIVPSFPAELGFEIGVHVLRATAATKTARQVLRACDAIAWTHRSG